MSLSWSEGFYLVYLSVYWWTNLILLNVFRQGGITSEFFQIVVWDKVPYWKATLPMGGLCTQEYLFRFFANFFANGGMIKMYPLEAVCWLESLTWIGVWLKSLLFFFKWIWLSLDLNKFDLLTLTCFIKLKNLQYLTTHTSGCKHLHNWLKRMPISCIHVQKHLHFQPTGISIWISHPHWTCMH